MKINLILLIVSSIFTQAVQAQSVYQNVYNLVNKDKLVQVLKEMTGVVPVTISGEQLTLSNRYSSEAKANYRKYWTRYFQNLGMNVQEFGYKTAHTRIESQGHNLEAVLPGLSDDSIVIIVHYDSIGQSGHETENPGTDDDMTGMAVSLETARILAPLAGKLKYTVRFVAADFEEWASPGLEGARVYAKYIQALAKQKGFKIIAAVDNEQIGWSGGDQGKTVDIFSCSKGFGGKKYDFKAIGDALETIATQFSKMKTKRDCMGENSDHFAMWEIGVPAVVYSEHNPFANPHFDQNGGDTFEKIDQDYFFNIAKIGVTFATTLAGMPNADFDLPPSMNLLTFFQAP